jgi:ribose 5-phosphate isomerase B
MKIAMACDHAGFNLKEEVKQLLESQGHTVLDFGTGSEESCDLPDYIYPASLAVSKGEADRGIFIDGVGYGSALIANKISGLYAAVCQDPFCAQLARSHSNTNVLCIGAKIIGSAIATEIVNTWMTTDFLSGEEKYTKRVERVVQISEAHLKPLFHCEIDKEEKLIQNVVKSSAKQPLQVVAAN